MTFGTIQQITLFITFSTFLTLIQSHPTVLTTSNPTTQTPIICTTPACPWPTCTFYEANSTYICTTNQLYLGCKCDPYVCTTPDNCPNVNINCGPLDEANPPYCGCPGCFFPPPKEVEEFHKQG